MNVKFLNKFRLLSGMTRAALAATLCVTSVNSFASSDDLDEFRYCHGELMAIEKASAQLTADKESMDTDKSLVELERALYENTRSMLESSNEYSRQYFEQQEREQRLKGNAHVASHNAVVIEYRHDLQQFNAKQERYNSRCVRSFSITGAEKESECGNSDDGFCKQ